MSIRVINEAIREANETCPEPSERETQMLISGSYRFVHSDPIVTDRPKAHVW
jgi:hypothetical protein